MTAEAKEQANFPAKWERVLLGDISSDISYGFTASSTEKPVGPRMLRITDIQDNAVNWKTVPYCKIDDKEVDKYLLSANDIVFARTGATVGKSFLIPNNVSNSVYASYLIRVRLQEGIDPKYISYFFLSGDYWNQIRENQAGIGQPNVNGSKLKKLEVPLAPPEQQKRIVAKIEELFSHIDAGIEALKKAKQLLKQYRQSVLKAAVTGELTKEWREENKAKLEPASQLLERILKERRQKWEEQQLKQFKAKGKMPKGDKWKDKYKAPEIIVPEYLPNIPEGWCWLNVECLATFSESALSSGPFGSNLGTKDYVEEGVPVLRGQNIQKGRIVLDNFVFVSEEKAESIKRSIAKPGDVVIIAVGSSGRPAVIPEQLKESVLSQNCNKVTCDTDIVNPEYLSIFLQSIDGQDQISGKTTDTVRRFFSLTNFKQIAVPIPGINEQKEALKLIEEKIGAADRLEGDIDSELKKINANKQSILATAFSGSLGY